MELKEPPDVASEPIDPLLIFPANRKPTVNVLMKPNAVLSDLLPRVSIRAFPLLTRLKLPSCAPIKLVLIIFTDKLSVIPIVSIVSVPEMVKLPLLYPERAVIGIVAFPYAEAGRVPTIRAAGMLVKLIAEPVK